MILPVASLCLLTACTENDVTGSEIAADGKTIIAFSKDEGMPTRASMTRAGFSATTLVKMRIMAEKDGSTDKRFADATATAGTELAANHETEHNPLNTTHSDLSHSTPLLFWDDAWGTDSKLTVWALAVNNMNEASKIPDMVKTNWSRINADLNPNWYTDATGEDKTLSYNVSTAQTTTTQEDEDLLFSNNISASGNGGRYFYNYNSGDDSWTLNSTMGNGRMQWTSKTPPKTGGKFDRGHLIFKRALALLEIHIKEGTDFKNVESTDFKWTTTTSSDAAQNIKLNFYQTGTFDVSTGQWSGQGGSPITQSVVSTVTAGPVTEYKAEAYVVPGNTLFGSDSKFIEFEIDYGKYYVSGDEIAKAIRAYATDHTLSYTDFTTTDPGKRYIINLVVNKKRIEKMTASVVDWDDVNSNNINADNTYSTFTFEDRRDDERGTRLEGETGGNQFNIYRAADPGVTTYVTSTDQKFWSWQTGYGNTPATKTWDGTNKVWKTDWYWPDNKTAYHFRAAGISGHTGSAPSMTIATAANDNFDIAAGATNGSGTYKDYIWGAPFSQTVVGNGASVKYNTTTGFDAQTGESHQILPAIAAMNEEINMVLFHMTSQITVNITTTTTSDKVTLKDGSTNTIVEIIGAYNQGKVQMGNGLVTTTGATVNQTLTTGTFNDNGDAADTFNGFSYGVVPQSLTGVKLRITTPDGNQYSVPLESVTAAVNNSDIYNPYSGTAGNYVINAWYPGFKYTYNITLKKKGITQLTASVVDWETVTGGNIDIDLEN